MMQITVNRAFYLGGKRQEVGNDLEVAEHIGRELIGSNKAKEYVPRVDAPSEKTKEKKHA